MAKSFKKPVPFVVSSAFSSEEDGSDLRTIQTEVEACSAEEARAIVLDDDSKGRPFWAEPKHMPGESAYSRAW